MKRISGIQMRRMGRRLSSLVLALVMVFSILPSYAITVDAASPTYTVSSSYKSSTYYSALCNVTLTGNQREDIVNVALSQVGYKEGSATNDNSGADDGSYDNYTEYNYWYHNYVSSGMPVGGSSAPWCATFVSWCAEQANVPSSILKRSTAAGHGASYFNVNFYSGSSTLASSDDNDSYFMGYNYTPQKGDLFFTRSWSHVGLVVSVSGSYVVTVEGNTNNNGSSQGDGVYKLSYRKISDLYFGVPNYQITSAPAKPIVSTAQSTYVEGDDVTISWNAVANNTYYWINVYRDGELIVDQSMGNSTSYTLRSAEPGEYRVNLSANNSVGTSGGTTCAFTVIDTSSPPEKPVVSTSKSSYVEGDSVTISWNAVANNTYYWINVYRDDEMIVNQSMGNSTSYTLQSAEPGEYRVNLSANNSAGTSGGTWCAFTVVDVQPGVRAWVSDTAMGDSASEYKVGNRYYLCYELYDAVSGELLDSVKSYSYEVTLTIYWPDGTVGSTYTYDNDNNWASLFATEPGTYTYQVDITGAFKYSDSMTRSIEEDPKRIYSSTDLVELVLDETGATTIYAWTEGYYHGTTVVSYSFDNSNVSCSWGEQQTDGKFPLTITANTAGTTTITLMSKVKDTGEILSSTTVTVVVTAKTYTVSYDANGGNGAPGSQKKVHETALTLSSTVPTRTGYTFLGWATSASATSAMYQPGATFTTDADTTLYAVWEATSTTGAKIVVDNVDTKAGETICIPVYIEGNPGVAYAKFKIAYSEALELVSAEDQGVLTGTFTASKTIDIKPYVIQWMGAADSFEDGCIVILTFKVADDADEGTYSIEITCEEACDAAYEDVTFASANVTVTVTNVLSGDVNGDGKVNGKDGVMLAQYLAEWDVEIDLNAADVNGDGKVNGKDGVLLAQYLAEWDVTLE